jgi:hypothetical protein
MLVRLVYAALIPLTATTLLTACGDDPQDADESSDTGAGPSTGDEASATDEPAATDPPTTNDPGDTTDDPTPTTGDDPDPTTGDDSDSDTDSDTTDGTTGDEPSPWDGEPLPDGEDGQWNWVDFPGARCRDGSATGIGVRYGSGPGLVVFFEGGGACFNALTCGSNPASYDGNNFNGSNNGIFDKDNPDNAVADWSFVYVPYCTGDVHAGARPDGTLPDVPGTFQFVGYLNVEQYLERIVPTFIGEVDQVLVTGVSAGGFGAAFNYDRIADAFPNKPVTLLDDSGPPMADAYMASCLQKKWRDAWGLDDSIPKECTDCFPADGGGIVNLGVYLANKHKDQQLALISSLGDNTIRFFFGFGNDDCKALFPSTSVDKYTEGLRDLRDNWLNEPADTWGSFYLAGEQHTWIGGNSYTTAQSKGVKLIDWVAELVGGNVSNVEP